MSLLDRIKADVKRIVSNTDEFARMATFTAPSGETATVPVLHTKHHLGLDAQLQKFVNTKNAHLSVSEDVLLYEMYPVRNANGEVNLQFHKVRVADSTGTEVLYNIDQWFPNETIGLITCILGTEEDE